MFDWSAFRRYFVAIPVNFNIKKQTMFFFLFESTVSDLISKKKPLKM